MADVTVLSMAGRAQTAPRDRQANAEILLVNMRRALATVLVAYKAPETAKSHAGAIVLNGTKEAALEIDRLTSVLASRQPRAISEATRKTAEAIGRLDGIFRMAGTTDPRAAEGMRALSANWATYTARYALARPAQSKAKANPAQVAEVRSNVARLRSEVQNLRTKVRGNAAVTRDLDALYARIDRLEQRRITEETYHSTLVALSAINGVFVGYEVVSRVYYPDVYVILHDCREQFAYYQGYWDGYYDAYYESLPATYYEAPFEAPDATVVNVDVTINQQVENYTTQNIDVFVQETGAAEAAFEVTPAAQDIPERSATTGMEHAPDAAELAETVKPNAETLRTLEVDGAVSEAPRSAADRSVPADADATAQPVPQSPGATPAGRDNDEKESSAAPATAPAQIKPGVKPATKNEGDSDASDPKIQTPAIQPIEPV
ncbi:hypothetical protein [Bradyrhizobium paxllaeri]|uniref:hypothetical protein n=1 Tax=Bradyrhizobium paxllaeri TaxID=190148 RepID=UPI00114692C4|nr:hypothetical protein [Bradyrhizobium paxllaeri]